MEGACSEESGGLEGRIVKVLSCAQREGLELNECGVIRIGGSLSTHNRWEDRMVV